MKRKFNKILIITNYLDIFPQRISFTESLDIKEIKDFLNKNSIQAKVINYNELNNNPNLAKSFKYIFYCSSQNHIYKDFILDHILRFSLQGKYLIPGIEHFLAHENKAFQSMILKDKNIHYPRSRIISNIHEGLDVLKKADFPVVLKTSEGWGSLGVHLVLDYKDGERLINNYMTSEDYPESKVGKMIIQKYIKNLEGDWKILIFGNKVSTLYRKVRSNDFRASGSGNFQFIFPSKKILDFAFKVKDALNCPWVSLDIMESKFKIYLGEYQVTHFGLLTALNCPTHLEKNGNKYEERVGAIDVDTEIANEILRIINRNEILNN